MVKSKSEQRRQIKDEKRKSAEQRQRMISLTVKGGLVVMAALVLLVLWQGWSANSAALPPAEIVASDHIKGSQSATVTITLYGDFQCPACKTQGQILERAWPRISDKARLVFRHYPLDTHRHAFLAARYAEAAARQGKFWELHDALYANQELWSSSPEVTAMFDQYSQSVGLDLTKLKADMETGEVRDKILSDQRGGTRAGVRATPSLFLNGRLVARNPGSVAEVVELVERTAASVGGG